MGNNNSSSFFNHARNFTITGGSFTEVHGNVIHTYLPSDHTHKLQSLSLHPSKNPSAFFIGHEAELQRLADYFDPHNKAIPAGRRAFLIYGMGGIGKTQLCLKFIERVEKWFTDIFWIDSSSQATITLSFEQIAEAKGLVVGTVPTVKYVMQWISSLKTTWLMVFDNADGGYELVEGHVPPGNRGNILITSRNRLLQRITSFNSLEVDEMQEEEAASLLLECGQLQSTFRDAAKKVVLALGFVPLAIDQAGAYMHSCQCDPDDYLELYQKHRKELLSQQPIFKASSGYKHSAYDTWEISVKEIEDNAKKKNQAAHIAMVILNVLGFLHHDQISEDIFKNAAEYYKGKMIDEKNNLPQATDFLDSEALCLDKTGNWDRLQFMSGIQVLQSFSLIKGINKMYSIHPLVHTWTRDRLSKAALHQSWLKARALLSCVARGNVNSNDHNLCVMLIPHLKAVYQHGLALKLECNYCDDEFYGAGMIFSKGSEWVEAETFLKKVIEVRTLRLGESHEDTIASIYNLATTYLNQGRWNEAEKLYEQVLKGTKLADDGPGYLSNMVELAYVYCHQGKLDEAEKLQVQVLETRKIKLGGTHLDTLRAMNDLALTYLGQGRAKEAEGLQLKVVEAREKQLGDDHHDTCDSRNILGLIYQRQGRLKEAEQLQVKVLEESREKQGEDHQYTLACMNNLVLTYDKQQRWGVAEELQAKVVEICKKRLGNDHPGTLRSMGVLAHLYQCQKRWKEAEALALQVLCIGKMKFGETHSHFIESMNTLEIVYRRQGRQNEADKMLEKVMELKRVLFSKNQPLGSYL